MLGRHVVIKAKLFADAFHAMRHLPYLTPHTPSHSLPQVTHDTEPRHLRDPGFLTRALEYRTARMLFTLSLRLRKHTPRLGAFWAWNK
jgi:hypothetical protein